MGRHLRFIEIQKSVIRVLIEREIIGFLTAERDNLFQMGSEEFKVAFFFCPLPHLLGESRGFCKEFDKGGMEANLMQVIPSPFSQSSPFFKGERVIETLSGLQVDELRESPSKFFARHLPVDEMRHQGRLFSSEINSPQGHVSLLIPMQKALNGIKNFCFAGAFKDLLVRIHPSPVGKLGP